MAKVRVKNERNICVGKHGGFHIKAGVFDYDDEVAAAIVRAGFGELVVEKQAEPVQEQKAVQAPENKMMPESHENKRRGRPSMKVDQTESSEVTE